MERGIFQEHVRISCSGEANLSIKPLVDANGAISTRKLERMFEFIRFFLRKMITYLLELYSEANKHGEIFCFFKFDSSHDVIPLKRNGNFQL